MTYELPLLGTACIVLALSNIAQALQLRRTNRLWRAANELAARRGDELIAAYNRQTELANRQTELANKLARAYRGERETDRG